MAFTDQDKEWLVGVIDSRHADMATMVQKGFLEINDKFVELKADVDELKSDVAELKDTTERIERVQGREVERADGNERRLELLEAK